MAIYVADTYAWMEYFDRSKAYKDLIENNIIKTPSMAFAELARTLKRRGISDQELDKFLEFIEKHSVILDYNHKIGIIAGKMSESEKLPLMDLILYAYSSNEALFLTGDSHFKDKKFVMFVK